SYRAIQLRGVAAGKIAARGAAGGREQRVADDENVADRVGDAVRRMARRGDDARLELADAECLAVREQAIELAAVGREIAELEDALERALHVDDAGAHRKHRA